MTTGGLQLGRGREEVRDNVGLEKMADRGNGLTRGSSGSADCWEAGA